MEMRSKFVTPGTSIHYYVVEFDPSVLSWSDFRGVGKFNLIVDDILCWYIDTDDDNIDELLVMCSSDQYD